MGGQTLEEGSEAGGVREGRFAEGREYLTAVMEDDKSGITVGGETRGGAGRI